MRDLIHEIGQLLIASVAIVVVYLMAAEGTVGGDAAVGFLGAVLGYVFGRSVGSVQVARVLDRNGNGDHEPAGYVAIEEHRQEIRPRTSGRWDEPPKR